MKSNLLSDFHHKPSLGIDECPKMSKEILFCPSKPNRSQDKFGFPKMFAPIGNTSAHVCSTGKNCDRSIKFL